MSKKKEISGKAALVTHGMYQYVRLPKEFRFEGDQVEIERFRNGVVLKPLAATVVVVKPRKTSKP